MVVPNFFFSGVTLLVSLAQIIIATFSSNNSGRKRYFPFLWTLSKKHMCVRDSLVRFWTPDIACVQVSFFPDSVVLPSLWRSCRLNNSKIQFWQHALLGYFSALSRFGQKCVLGRIHKIILRFFSVVLPSMVLPTRHSNTTDKLSNTTDYSLLDRVFSSEKKNKSLPLISHILMKPCTCFCVSFSQVCFCFSSCTFDF